MHKEVCGVGLKIIGASASREPVRFEPTPQFILSIFLSLGGCVTPMFHDPSIH